jgi:uncharacterized membrane protein YvlD (DUF360 family)
MFDKILDMKNMLILGLILMILNFIFIFMNKKLYTKELSLTSSTYSKFIWFGIVMRLITHIWIDYLFKSYGNILCKN